MNKILSIETLDRYGRPTGTEEIPCAGAEDSIGPSGSVTASRPGGTGTRRVRVIPEEGEPFTISGRRAARLGLKPGGELPPELHEEILKELKSSCMRRCGTLLGRRDYPVDRLRKKLQDAGYPSAIVEECIEKLEEAHYLDDRRYARTYIRSHMRDRSRLRILHDLAERGIDGELVEEAFAEIAEETDPDEAQMVQIRRLLEKRGYDPARADFAMRQKTMGFLHRKGYEPDMIRRAMEI